MRIIVSAKYLLGKLSEIDFEKDQVINAEFIDDDKLVLSTNTKKIEVRFSSVMFSREKINQERRNWYWVKNLLESVQEQPIVLEINEGVIEVIFQY